MDIERGDSVVVASGLSSCFTAHGILTSQSRLKAMSLALEGGFFNCWTTRDVPILHFDT